MIGKILHRTLTKLYICTTSQKVLFHSEEDLLFTYIPVFPTSLIPPAWVCRQAASKGNSRCEGTRAQRSCPDLQELTCSLLCQVRICGRGCDRQVHARQCFVASDAIDILIRKHAFRNLHFRLSFYCYNRNEPPDFSEGSCFLYVLVSFVNRIVSAL